MPTRPIEHELIVNKIPTPPSISDQELDQILISRGGLLWIEEDEQPGLEWFANMLTIINKNYRRHIAYARDELYKDKPREIETGFICNSNLSGFILVQFV